jgi:RNA recognition motif-containing protein
MKLLVRNLARTSSEQDIQSHFSAHGKVTECTLVLDQQTGLSKGFAFVEMPDEKEARTALKRLNQTRFQDSTIRVKLAQS